MDPAWDAVYMETPFEDPRGRWQDLKAKLGCAAQIAGVSLFQRAEDDSCQLQSTSEKSGSSGRPAFTPNRKLGSTVDQFSPSCDSDESDAEAYRQGYAPWESDEESPVARKQARATQTQ